MSPRDIPSPSHFIDSKAVVADCGGASRADTVRNGLDELLTHGARAHDWVLVHDAARCLVRPEWINALIDACLGDPVGGLLALPLADTLKSERGGRVDATIDRRAKWQAQTPQMFRIAMLRDREARSCAEARRVLDGKLQDHLARRFRPGRAPSQDTPMNLPKPRTAAPGHPKPGAPLLEGRLSCSTSGVLS